MPSSAILRPNRLSITPSRSARRDPVDTWYIKNSPIKECEPKQYEVNFEQSGNPFKLSRASRRKLIDSVVNLYHLSPARTVTTTTGRQIRNFRVNFITLTLPSQQRHSDKELKGKVLNHLLVELRKFYGLKNYVWRAELQENENIHFHVMTDQFIQYRALRRRWNRILDKLGYIEPYTRRMAAMTFQEYHQMRNKYKRCPVKKSRAAYAAGQKCGWTSPNSVDVKTLYSAREAAGYCAKYMAKDADDDQPSDELKARMLDFGRCWGRSQSLSRLRYQQRISLQEIKGLLAWMDRHEKRILRKVGDFFTCYYFDLDEFPQKLRAWWQEHITANALLYNYVIPNTS